jgi:hypothetical protein
LELDDTLLAWDDICTIVSYFPSLTKLETSSNALSTLTTQLPTTTLKSLTLEYNDFTSLSQLSPLSNIQTLEVLLLKGNRISSVGVSLPTFPKTLHYLDISYNAVSEWSLVDSLPTIFPGMTSLRFAHNRIYTNPSQPSTSLSTTETHSSKTIEEGYMLTLARLSRLKVLNFSTITTADRTNGEMYYLSCIAKELSSVPSSQEDTILRKHPRYRELVEIYGEPAVVRREEGRVNPAFLEARLIRFTLYLAVEDGDGDGKKGRREEKVIEIPKSFDVYRVKGIVGRAFSLRPLELRLTWETGEWDPVAGYEDEVESSDDEDQNEGIQRSQKEVATGDDEARDEGMKRLEEKDLGKWMKREVEIMDGTRQVGFWVEGSEAIVRVEKRQ